MTRKRILTFLLEILFGLVLAGAIILYAAVGPFRWMPSLRWWSLAGTTALIFWAVVKQFKRYWHVLSFWYKVGGLLIIHCLAYTAVLLRVSEWRLLWFVPLSVVEGGLLVLALDKLVRHSR
jgi:hypothetical protein